ncbi:UvrD-helicase domain-containing protein [Pelagicoccus sp. SDUM812005]|uniref:UvrD-helicase domain-containing protein n=1 Tax=Pelagicoccus sp. SDUM812005 TaxID=3041257 RepID=UPI00280FB3E1|nr:UvrD-helicase domain-containing protein [Pelagicoccus sp. SDUM812005]MDQ8183759.1 UvrD-helicase domain-containing protein [Pelagicoccus sp. SDUM812005]
MMELHKGTTLIEASAGTGKTYTLCRIALKLTLQHGITLDRILAVTFTEAATEELAARIQKLYQSTLRELELGDPQEAALKECIAQPDFDLEAAKNALRYSLEVFDEAPISTIHSFCKRSLDLVALETQTPFDAELSQVEEQLIEQLQSEYIRQEILEASQALSLALGFQKNFEKRLNDIGRQTSTHPEAKLRPTPLPVDFEALERRFAEIPEAIRDLAERKADYLAHLRKTSRNAKQLRGDSPDLEACLKRGALLPQDLEWLEDFRSEAWSKAVNKGGAHLPVPPLISLVDVVKEQIEAAFTSLIYNYKPWLSERLEKAKLQANVISFNDLLHHLSRALKSEAGERVKQFLSAKYDAALIDEFQDTDRVQLDIAKALFGEGEHYLFYIGDPKQAIYRFRGADIYAYFQATEGGEIRKEALTKNYRSAPRLVAAVNTLFNSAAAGFVDERIQFEAVEPGTDPADFPPCQSPFKLHQLTVSEFEKFGSGWYRDVLAERAANDFVARINQDPDFDPASAAFLVNSKHEADTLSLALAKRGVSVAIRADRSVFQTQEAADLGQILAALASPTRTSLKRGAYAALDTSLTAKDMVGPAFEESAAPIFEYITEWAKDWFSRNFDVALHGLLQLLDTKRSNALDSERRYANICQLSELLSEARDAEDLSPRGLLNWLSRKANANVSQHEEWQTRISSDEGKPQVITVHKSKGLQFPIVYLPFLGLRRVRADELSATYHGPDDEMVIDYAPEADSPAVTHSQREALAEDVRLLYVALTRAERENIVYLCPEAMARGNCSSFAQFLLDEGLESTSAAVAEKLERIAAASDQTIAFEQSPLEAGPFVALQRKSESDPEEEVFAKPLQKRKRMPLPDRVLSFSSLNKSLHIDETDESVEATEADSALSDESAPIAEEPEVEEAPEGISIFTLPKGTHAGDLLHLILERFDFSRPETLAATTQMAFDALQFEPRDFEPIVAGQIGAIAKAKLNSKFTSFALEDVAPQLRVPELEFSYPVSGDVKEGILDALAANDLGRIPASWLSGLAKGEAGLPASMLRGFIDLVLEHEGRLYIFDWKSNYLGPTPTDYDQNAILESMSDHNYFLQYLLYCVALKRFAEWRFPQRRFEDLFGGVFYIYARGISPGKETGIYYDLPTPELLEALDQALMKEGIYR